MSLFLHHGVTRLPTHPESVIFLHQNVKRLPTRPKSDVALSVQAQIFL